MDITSTRTPPTNCPSCSYKLDAATDAQGNAAPSPGDISMCIQCHSFLVFNDDLTLRMMALEEVSALPDDIRNTLVRMRRIASKLPPR